MSEKPIALLVGDSICMGYRPFVKKRLEDKVEIIGIDDNGGDSGNILKNFGKWFINRNANLIHFNCGLHDLKIDPNTGNYQQPLDAYKENLPKIVQRLKNETNAIIVWATITPVIDEWHSAVKGFDRHIKDVDSYNKVASAIMKNSGIIIDDLYSVIMNDKIENCLMNDGVHINEHGNELLNKTVSDCILKELGIA